MNDTSNPAPLSATGPALSTSPPWGFWSSTAWGLLSVGVWFAVQFIAIIVALVVQHGGGAGRPPDAARIEQMAAVTAFAILAATPLQIGVLAIAARAARWRPADYFAMLRPTGGQLAFALGCLALALVASDATNYALGRGIAPEFLVALYRDGRDHGSLVSLVIAIVIAAPLAEEITFRGFLYRGWSQTRLGVKGTIVLTSLVWAAMHVQYDWLGMAQIFLLGLLFGWLRWASGSTTLTIVLHIATNAASTLQTAIKVEWMS